ncbi:AIPR family protein [uncultured Maricaulis sp.]|uniref:AIPR family protein n=1 Tax=uncultured Maricaulis sp. TaxID=174710 RepID=UPI0030D7A654
MGVTTHKIRAPEARRIKHPVFPEIEKHYLTVRAIDVPDGIRKDANARDGEGQDLRKQVYREVQKSLLAENSLPGIFDLKNKGIVILAESVRKVGEDVYEIRIREGQGIVDGGHTYEIICKAQAEDSIPEDQYVEIQIRTGVDDDLITEISAGLNTGIAVKHHSIANLDGKYEWIKEEVADQPYASRIAWRETDAGDYDVRDLICVLEAMNVIDFANESGIHPISAYEARERVTKKFSDDADLNELSPKHSTYQRLRPLLRDALVLYDTIRHDFREVYNRETLGNAGALDIVERARKGKSFDFPFAGLDDSEYRLTKGALYPIFAAFRNKVWINSETGLAEWDGGFDSVLELWDTTAVELVRQTKAAIKDYGRKPDVLGKSRGHWNNVHKTVEVHLLRSLHRSK